jgi:hypothetical protein
MCINIEINQLADQELVKQSPSLNQRDFEAVSQLGVCTTSWVSHISPWISNLDHFNYLVPVTTVLGPLNATVLTGGMREVEAGDLTEEAKRNIICAKKVISYVQESLLFSDNYLSRSRVYRLAKKPAEVLKIEQVVSQAIGSVRATTLNAGTLEEIDLAAKANKTGRCQEMAVVGYLYGKTVLNEPKIEMFQITYDTYGDHTFLVIGRDPNSAPKEYWNFGPDALVCDPWTGAYFPARDLEKYLLDFQGVIRMCNRSFTRVALFGSYQTIELHPLMGLSQK